LDYFGARYFSGAQGMFTSADRLFFQAEMLTDPQRFNLYSYVRNNPLRFVDPTGDAIELVGDEEERKRQIEALKATVGAQAGAYLYENKIGDKYYVGIYSGGPSGQGPAFESINPVAKAFGGIINDQQVARLQILGSQQQLPIDGGGSLASRGVAGITATIDTANGNEVRSISRILAKASATFLAS
jgi:RHS repeat-associated protein